MSFSLGNILFLVIMLRCQVFLSVTAQNYQLTSSCGGSVQAGGSCTLMCYTGDASHTIIQWLNETTFYIVSQGSCSSTSPSLPAEYTTSCPSSTNYTLTINNVVYGRDRLSWRCDHQFGGRESNRVQMDVSVNLTSVTITRNATSISCVAVSNPPPSMTLYRDGISVTTSPAAVEGDTGWTATINYQLTGTSRNSLYYCQASNTQTTINSTYSYPEKTTTTTLPASPTTTNNTSAATPPDPCDSDCAWYPVIILVVLLVVKIVTDVIFVAYRWVDKCKQIIDTDRQRNILYRICFIQGIINSICGVTFIIVICLAYPKCLGEALAIAALVISIFVLITGLIYIVMFLCKQIIDKMRNILNWICFVQGIINSICGVVFIIIICVAYAKCLEESLPIAVIVIGVIVVITGVINIIIVFVHPGDKSSPDHSPPSSLPPIPPSMASPRKPVPPRFTTARTLPSPTSDPASDSAVYPTVYLEPLSFEEPKKKEKKRKKRKMKNPAGDSDE